MQGKIGLEEHFAIPETLNDSKGFLGEAVWPELESRLLDIQERRLREMDRHGMQLMLLSLNAPAVQAIPDPKRALAMQDPDQATRELRRCVKELGFRGALVNGFSQVRDARCAHGLRAVRRTSAPADHPRPHGRVPALQQVARGQPQRLDRHRRAIPRSASSANTSRKASTSRPRATSARRR